MAAALLVGAANLCGFDENQELRGYCAAGDTVRFLVVAVPAATVILGYLLSLWTGRLTPIAIAALCAIAVGLIALGAGFYRTDEHPASYGSVWAERAIDA